MTLFCALPAPFFLRRRKTVRFTLELSSSLTQWSEYQTLSRHSSNDGLHIGVTLAQCYPDSTFQTFVYELFPVDEEKVVPTFPQRCLLSG